MNEEELKEALKIIKEPITVNSVNYKYFDEINYDKLIMVYDNCLWFANNLEQLASNLEQLQQKNQQLKEQLKQKEDIINKTKDVIEKMLTIGYSKGLTYYYPAKNGEFGIRAKVLLEILDNKGE